MRDPIVVIVQLVWWLSLSNQEIRKGDIVTIDIQVKVGDFLYCVID